MNFIVKFQPSALLTYLGVIFALGGFYYRGDMHVALLCLFLAALCDAFDGRFARRFHRSTFEQKFGIAIDSVADAVAFIALPSFLLLSIDGTFPTFIVVAFFALAGVTRLAVFTAEAEPGRKVSHYRGLPVTFAGFLIPPFYFLAAQLPPPGLFVVMCLLYVLLGLLFVLDIKIKKP